MKHFDRQNKLTLQVRTERGVASVDIGIEWLSRQERNYLFTLIKKTEEGGTVGFGVEPGSLGQSILKITLGQAIDSADISAVGNGASA